jgi:DNA repair exonuclease SbcCD ATPase subunit
VGGGLPPPVVDRADALEGLFRTMMSQAEELARRQAELEARQDAVLGKMTLVDEGRPSARHLAELEAELDAQLQRVEARLDFIGRLEQRLEDVQAVVGDVERRLGEQLARRGEIESLKNLCDLLVAQMVELHERSEAAAAAQQRLLPLADQVASLVQAIDQAQRALAGFEERLAGVAQGTHGLEQTIESLAGREARLQSLRAEFDELGQASKRAHDDLQFVRAHAADLAALRASVEALIGRAVETDEKIATIESRRKLVEEVQSRTSTLTHMLGDIQVNLEMLGEQRAVVDHIGEKVARLDFLVQEAQNTLRALQREREVAERVEQGIKALRARSSVSQPD